MWDMSVRRRENEKISRESWRRGWKARIRGRLKWNRVTWDTYVQRRETEEGQTPSFTKQSRITVNDERRTEKDRK